MTATGIGAAVRRKEDLRFITGKGQYTDDISRPGETRAVFVRSPHAHAKIKRVDTKAAAAMPGVLAVLTGAQLAGRQDRQSHLRLDDPFQGRLADEDGAASGARGGQGLLCRRSGGGGGRRDAGAGARRRREGQGRLRGAAGGGRSGQGASRGPQIHEVAPKNTIYQWHLGDAKAADAAIKSAKHVTKLDIVNNRLVPNAMEPRVAIGEYDSGTQNFTLWNTTQNPHVARLVIAAFVGMAPEHKLRVIAPDVGGGFGSKIFIYPEEVVCLWASKKVGRPVKWTCDRSEAFLADAHGRDHVTHAEMAFDEDGKITGLKVKTIANLGAYMSTFSSSVPTYLYATLLSGQYDIPAIYCEVDAVYTNTVPVDAYRGAGRPEATFVVERLVEVGARELGIDPADLRKTQLHQVVPAPDAGDHDLRRRRLSGLAEEGDGDRPTSRASASASATAHAPASCAASAIRPISRPAASRRRRRSARSARASACGNPPRCGSIRPARSKC